LKCPAYLTFHLTNKKPWTVGDGVIKMWDLDERGKPYCQAKQEDENLVSN